MDLPEELKQIRLRVECRLEQLSAAWDAPPRLSQAMAYSLLGGGKRLRPILVVSTYEIFSDGRRDPLPLACAFEYIHTYSLIHDDLPAMDNDDLRRGQPTCHRRFDEATAILTGDALLTEAFSLLASAYASEPTLVQAFVSELARASGCLGMVGGQTLDMEATGKPSSLGRLEQMHAMKTGALLTAAVRCGAILGGAGREDLADLTAFGRYAGLAFQVADDILDVTGTPESIGKATGKDAGRGKATFPGHLGLDESRNRLRLLCRKADNHLERFGIRSEPLRAFCRFVAGSAGC